MAGNFLVAGIDFGTSFSKVVLREQSTREAAVVTFHGFDDGLLASLIGIDGDNLLPPGSSHDFASLAYLKMLAVHAADGSALDSGKISIPRALSPMRRDGDGKILFELLVFYFAHVMAATEVFIRNRSPWRYFDFSGRKGDHLIYQLAVPTGLCDKDGAIERLFQKALLTAFELKGEVDGQLVAPQRYQEWRRLVEDRSGLGLQGLQNKHPWQCLDYPEVLAAMQTVFRSPNPQQDGRYITMDVGAGTVELNAFYRNTGEHLLPEERQTAQRRHDYYAVKVCALGSHNLHDPHQFVSPLTTAEELSVELGKEITAMFAAARIRQPNHGTVRGQRTWDRARLLIFGGGASVDPYRSTYWRTLENVGIADPQILALPAATDLPLPDGVEFGRFAVAYGISFFRRNLDEWRPPDDVLPFNQLYPADPTPPPEYGVNWDD